MPTIIEPLLPPKSGRSVRVFHSTAPVLRARAVIHRRSQGSFALIDQNPSIFNHSRNFVAARHHSKLVGYVANYPNIASVPYEPSSSDHVSTAYRRKNLTKMTSSLPISESGNAKGGNAKKYIECQAELFEKDKKELLKIYEGKFVLYENGKVLDEGESRIEIVKRAYKKSGEVKPLFIAKVSCEEEPVYESMSPLVVEGSIFID